MIEATAYTIGTSNKWFIRAMRWRLSPGYLYLRAGTHPDVERGLGKERAAKMRAEVARNRLESRSAKVGRTGEDGGVPRGRVARGFALVAALFGAHPAP